MTESREAGPEPVAAILPEVLADLEQRNLRLREGDRQQEAADRLAERARARRGHEDDGEPFYTTMHYDPTVTRFYRGQGRKLHPVCRHVGRISVTNIPDVVDCIDCRTWIEKDRQIGQIEDLLRPVHE